MMTHILEAIVAKSGHPVEKFLRLVGNAFFLCVHLVETIKKSWSSLSFSNEKFYVLV